ncbi:carbonic anhydrase [Corynebacterium uropygiale]|uniref:Carbonic anhydrase n=1 Tax=Corynebacterium uropygiale TaxID=1775911 RepID=A0A9X1QQA2_9CORY|nr:carbonic anhydrase [Corynebacterium uropygiale]MCF4007166.1 carbonic anhydrase [Corynebacterium uropygiale]
MPLHDELTSPQAVWDELLAGNERFAAQASEHPHMHDERRAELSAGQSPRAVVLSCSDSRAPVELLFDSGLGDIFVVRTAGEILGLSVLASVEYAVNGLGCPLVVVLGHEFCGAVGAALTAVTTGELPGGFSNVLVERVTPSVLAAQREGHTESADVERVHVRHTVDTLFAQFPALREKVAEGSVGVVGARYRVSDNRVETVCSHGVE